jgi:hypothetical protein
MYLSCNHVLYVFWKKKSQQINNNNNLRKKCWNPTYYELQSSAIHKLLHSFSTSSLLRWVSTKSSIDLGSRLCTTARERKLLLVKYFHIIQQFSKINYLIIQNLTIHFSCETNRIDMSVCVVIRPWIFLVWFFASDCNQRKKRSTSRAGYKLTIEWLLHIMLYLF